MFFREDVLNFVKTVPKGEARTYKQVAAAVGRPGAYRAVGNILARNADQKIPCHRVIRSDGSLGGYNRGVARKRTLLHTEGVSVIK